jgi:hypothetical protein
MGRYCRSQFLHLHDLMCEYRRVCAECGDMYHLTCLPPTTSSSSSKKEATAAAAAAVDWTCRSCLKCSSCGTAAVKEHQEVTIPVVYIDVTIFIRYQILFAEL